MTLFSPHFLLNGVDIILIGTVQPSDPALFAQRIDVVLAARGRLGPSHEVWRRERLQRSKFRYRDYGETFMRSRCSVLDTYVIHNYSAGAYLIHLLPVCPWSVSIVKQCDLLVTLLRPGIALALDSCQLAHDTLVSQESLTLVVLYDKIWPLVPWK